MLVHKNFTLASEESPHTDVKFSTFKKQRALNVFLDDTACKLWPTVDEESHFIKVREYFNASALVSVRRFD
jgi:hypothetical protein